MIASMLGGLVGGPTDSSKATLGSYTPKFNPANQRSPLMNIDGGLGLSTARRSTLPVVVLPLLEEFGDVLQIVADSVYKLQQSTLGFRVLAVTDLPNFKAIRPYGWAISHLVSESSWEDIDQSWVGYVHSEIDKSEINFGSSIFLEVSSQGINPASWEKMCLASGLHSAIKCPTVGTPYPQINSWRGWIENLPSGKSTCQVIIGDAIWELDVEKNPYSSMVLLVDPSSENSTTTSHALSRNWNVARLTGNEAALKRPAIERAVSSLMDGLSLKHSGINTILPEYSPTQSSRNINMEFIKSPDLRVLTRAENLALATWSSLTQHNSP